jgi:predicted ArsR family transcriptional regulator
MTQQDLDYGKAYGGFPPHSNATTSREAAAEIKPKATAIREKVYEALRRDNGLTCDEACAILRIDGNTARPRIRELVIAGRVRDGGRRRTTDTGRKAIVWEVVP